MWAAETNIDEKVLAFGNYGQSHPDSGVTYVTDVAAFACVNSRISESQ
jgi:hypothetical protein